MSAVLASSPMCSPMCSPAFKSPLQAFTAESCHTVAGEEVYADAQARLVQWRKDLLSSASFDAQQGIRELRHEREHVKDLKSDLASVQGLVEAASQLQAGGARLAEVVHNSSEAAAERTFAVTKLRDDLDKLSETHRQEQRNVEDTNAQRQAVADAQYAEAVKLMGTYQDRLGLAITRVAPQTVRMSFSLLDEADSAREFFFTLGLADLAGKTSENYYVRECVPQVPDVDKLLADLNADACSTTALPRFVCSIRRAFLKLATADMPAPAA